MLSIYLTDLQAYNEGHLVGRWIKLPLTPFELSQALSEVLTEGESVSGTENHEEYFITDYEWSDIDFYDVDEHHSLYDLNKDAEALEALNDYQLKAVAFLFSEGIVSNIDDALTKVDDIIIYDYSDDTSFTDVYELLAYDLVEEGCFGEIPITLENYIDYEAIGKDLSYDYSEFIPNILGRAS